MEIIIVMIVFSVLLACTFLYAFFWAADNSQFNDLYTPKWRILKEDESVNNNDKQEPSYGESYGENNG